MLACLSVRLWICLSVCLSFLPERKTLKPFHSDHFARVVSVRPITKLAKLVIDRGKAMTRVCALTGARECESLRVSECVGAVVRYLNWTQVATHSPAHIRMCAEIRCGSCCCCCCLDPPPGFGLAAVLAERSPHPSSMRRVMRQRGQL